MPLTYTDWEITQKHAEVIQAIWPDDVADFRLEVRKKIPGVTEKRITEKIKAGIWLKPLGSRPGRTFSNARDINRRSLFIFVSGSTTAQSDEATDYEKIRDAIISTFQDRRATGLDGELYSFTSAGDYDIDDVISRRHDVDLIQIETRFREDR